MITSRPLNKPFAGFYEFPGGKVKKNEPVEYTDEFSKTYTLKPRKKIN